MPAPHRTIRWGDVCLGALTRSQHKPKGSNRTLSGRSLCRARTSAPCVFRAGHAAGRASPVFVWVAVFVAVLTVIAVIYYLIRVRRHPEEETRPPQ
jgi:hypothetical protein